MDQYINKHELGVNLFHDGRPDILKLERIESKLDRIEKKLDFLLKQVDDCKIAEEIFGGE